MEDISESLLSVGCVLKCTDNAVLADALQNGVKSEDFRAMISWIANELSVLANLEEQINENGDINEFLLELSGFLKELGCPYPQFVTGPISNRFQSQDDRVLLLQFLISELMAWKMCLKMKAPERVVIEIAETGPAAALKSIMLNLNLGKPPDNVAPKLLFDKINQRIEDAVKRHGPVPKALFSPTKQLTAEQWTKLDELAHELDAEYDLRRDMLITRLDVTVQSFHWSENIKGKEDKLTENYTNKRKELDYLKHGGKTTDIAELLASRQDIAIIDKTSSAKVRENTQIDIQKHVIGRVPDRGGRAREHAAPPREMPSWQKQRNPGGGGGGFGGAPQQQRNQQNNYQRQQSFNNQQNQSHNNNRGNNRVQGGWSQSGGRDFNRQNSDNASGGGYYQKGGHNNHQHGYGQQQQKQYGSGGQYHAGSDRDRSYQGNGGNGGGGYQGNSSGQDRNRSGGYSNYNRGGGGGGGRRY